MRIKVEAGLAGLLAAALSAAPARAADLAGASHEIVPTAVNSAGARPASVSNDLAHAVGAIGAGVRASVSYMLSSGFIAAFTRPGTAINLAATAQSSSGIGLTWSAPGLDGNEGQLVAGTNYYIQFSTFSSAVFAPANAQIVISTQGVSPGAPQAYGVTGLAPSTIYFFTLWTKDGQGAISANSNLASAMTLTATVVAPSSPTIDSIQTAALSSTALRWAWSYSGPTVDGFRVVSSTGGRISPDLAASATFYIQGGLTPNASAAALIEAFNSTGSADSSLLQRFTLAAAPSGLAVASAGVHSVTLAWSTNGNPAGTAFPLRRATSLGGPFVTLSSPTATPYTDASVAASTTYFYQLAAVNGDGLLTAFIGPVSTTTAAPKDALPPAPVPGVRIAASTASVVLNWSPITTNADYTPIDDLAGYRILRSELLGGTTSLTVDLSSSVLSYTDLPSTTQVFYQVLGVDTSGNVSPSGAVLATSSQAFVSADSVLIELPPATANLLLAQNNPTGRDLAVDVQRETSQETGGTIRSFDIRLIDAQTGAPVGTFRLGDGGLTLVFALGSSTSVPTSLFAARRTGALQPSPVTQAVYFFNGVEYIRLGGRIDTASQTITVLSPNLGRYQVRQAVKPASFSFDPTMARPHIFTPNGDGKNDRVFFVFDNPNNVDVEGKVFDINGGMVASSLKPGPFPGISLMWDGIDGSGHRVPAGVYLYQLRAEDRVFTGTVVVAR